MSILSGAPVYVGAWITNVRQYFGDPPQRYFVALSCGHEYAVDAAEAPQPKALWPCEACANDVL